MLNIEKRQYLLYNLTNKDVKGTAVNWTSIEFRKKCQSEINIKDESLR